MVRAHRQFENPTVLTVPQFSARVDKAYQELVHGGDPVRSAEVVSDSWFRLDPANTAHELTTSTAAQLQGALGRMATVAAEADTPRGRKRFAMPLGRLRSEAQLDQANTALHLPGDTYAAGRPNLERVKVESDEAGKRGTNSETSEIFARVDGLSARAMLLHMDARAAAEKGRGQHVRQAVDNVLRSSLAGLIKDTVTGLGDVYGLYKRSLNAGKDGTNVSGRLVEVMYFGYQLLDAYRNDTLLKDSFPRFAFTREDRARTGYNPLPRKFDVAVVNTRNPETSRLVQVKNSSGRKYDPAIEVWRPKRDVVTNAEHITQLFKDIVNKDSPDAAWRGLVSYFGTLDGHATHTVS